MALLDRGNALPGQSAVKSTGDVGPDLSKTQKWSIQDLKPERFDGAGGTASGLQYSVETFRYPEKTASDNDLKHYMVFFVNVRERSKFKGTGKRKEIQPTTLGGTAFTASTKLVGGLGGAALGSAGGAFISNLIGFNKAGITSKAIKLALTGLGAGAGAFAGSSDTLSNLAKSFVQPDRTFRISDAIMLAINEKPSVSYGVDYDGTNLGGFIGALAGPGSAVDAIKNQGSELAGLVALNIAKIPQGIASVLGADFALSEAVQVGTGLAPNPFREQVFRNVENREFRFEYRFFPRSVNEATAVRNIIDKFKLHMHPELSQGGLFYVYPSTFDIAYYFNGAENANLHRISTCVLTKMNVDYGGAAWNTFNDGMPTEINLRLEFRELERLTKERIDSQKF